MPRLFVSTIFCFLGLLLVSAARDCDAAEKPNVVIVITDDQGYGDLSCLGNPVLKTPAIDELFGDSIRLTDYHVAPTCSPTRCAFLTGHWTNRTGVWHTIMGRSMLRENEVTMGDVFSDNGYATGMFGKWHLGDNYPYRAEDRGFDEVLRHGGGGVGQTPDFWDNAYFDGQYLHNGVSTPVDGFCTDVFFDCAKQFIKQQSEADRPFLAYLAPNAPHGPMHAPERYSAAYSDLPVPLANFFGMIANIDDNVAELRRYLNELGISDNTIFIFTTDNGTSSGQNVFNARMRGAKGSQYDGGHRVPFFVHWPDGNLVGGRDIAPITSYVDVLPTLIDLCEINPPSNVKFDGSSIMPLLRSASSAARVPTDWPDRILVTDSQRVKDPIKWRASAVMTSQYRLINGRELYNIKLDPGQRNDIATAHTDVVNRLRQFYEDWWAELEPTFANETPIYLGHPADNPARLTCHDWITTDSTPWNQSQVRAAMNGDGNKGYWNVKVVEDGDYEIRLRRWPDESGAAIDESVPTGADVPGVKPYRATPGKAIAAVKATVRIADQVADLPVDHNASEIVFDLQLPAGQTKLTATFETESGEIYGAYYAYVRKK